MAIDWALQEALEEVDALTPETPPVAPPRPPPKSRYLGAFVAGAFVLRVNESTGVLTLSNGRLITVEQFDDVCTSPARV